KISQPMRVDRVVNLKAAADPFQKFFLAFFPSRFDRIMNRHQPYALVHKFVQLLNAISLKKRVPAATIAVDHDSGGSFKCCFGVRWPAVAVDDRCYARHMIQAGLEQQTARAMLVFSRPMTLLPRYQNNLLVSARHRQRTKRERQAENAG